MTRLLKNHWEACKKTKLLLLLRVLFCSLIIIAGCSTASNSLFWTEYQGELVTSYPAGTPDRTEVQRRFATNDLAKAQKEIPFEIILPTYIPGKEHNRQMVIDGPLDTEGTSVEIRIKYDVDIGDPKTAMILIIETNRHRSLGDVELEPDLEVINLAGFEVTKSKDDLSETDTYFSFNQDGIFYLIEMHLFDNENSFNIDEESLKIVESFINQLK
jgi:hypothetical protein